jgi:predicted transcriptional regulator
MTPKEAAIALIQKMPDEATWEEIAYRVYTRSRIEAGLADMAAGRVTSQEDYQVEAQEWLASLGRKKQKETTTSPNGLLATP